MSAQEARQGFPESILMATAMLLPLVTIGGLAADQASAPADPKVTGGSAGTPEQGMSTAERFAAIDTDGDGRIGQQEARTALKRLFARMNEDQSGNLAPDEFCNFHLPDRANPDQKAFEEVDLDGNGRVDRTEYLETGMARFRATDADGNSAISLAEYCAFAR